MGPLDWTGPQFLGFYVVLLAIGTVTAFLASRWLASSGAMVASASVQLAPTRLAYLMGGPRRAVQAGLASLLASRAVEIDAHGILGATDLATKPGDPIERAIVEAARHDRVRARDVGMSCRAALDRTEETLTHDGLLVQQTTRGTIGLMNLAILGSIALIGAAKVWVGITRGKPTLLLVLLLIATVFAFVILQAVRPRVTAAGRSAIDRERLRYDSTRRNAAFSRDDYERTGPVDPSMALMLPLGVALLGTSALANTPLEEDRKHLAGYESSGSSGWSNSSACGGGSDSGSSSGGGDSGGSSCSGGGCGGCGGGGD